MRVFDNGCFFTVQCSTNDVEAFAGKWPCFGRARPVSFQFDKRNGDLVDMSSTSNMDEYGVSCLADDAKAYGKKRLKLA